MDKYHLAVGRFIEAFAVAEYWLLAVLWNVSNVDDATGKALFSGTRAKGAMDLIGRVYESRNAQVPAQLERAFIHLREVNTTRDRMVHWGFSTSGVALSDAQIVISNKSLVHAARRELTYPITPEMIDQMTADMEIVARIFLIHLISTWPDSAIKTEILLQHEPISRAQWQYTPPQPMQTTPSQSQTRRQWRGGKRPPSQA